MRELALHILDLVENGLAAGARLITILVREDGKEERVEITIADDGRGIPAALQQRVLDPFYTTRTTRRVGLGLALFREAARRCGGEFQLTSEEGREPGCTPPSGAITSIWRRSAMWRAPRGVDRRESGCGFRVSP